MTSFQVWRDEFRRVAGIYSPAVGMDWELVGIAMHFHWLDRQPPERAIESMVLGGVITKGIGKRVAG